MFAHNFKYAFITLFKNKMLIFWTFAFPIILGTLFYMAFSNIENGEKLSIIDIAIVENADYNDNTIFKKAFDNLGDPNNADRLFNIKYTTKEEADNLLTSKDIVGYLELKEDKPILTFSKSGIDETILKYVTEEVLTTSDMINNLVSSEIEKEIASGNYYNIDYESIYENVSKLVNIEEANIKDVSSKHLSYTMIEFYTLIAMTALYGGMLSMVAINGNLANMSNKGKRIAVSPAKKGTVIISSLLASFIAQLIGLAILFVYTILVLKVDYGSNVPLIILLACIGSLAGLSLGTFVGTVFKTGENSKTGILIAFTMLCSYLSGMMGITMKYVVDKNVPFINKINPANMITDGLYALYYYDTLNRFWVNIISLLIFSGILILISFISLRRQKYDSI